MDPLESLLLELAGRNVKLACCWKRVLQDLSISLEDLLMDGSPAEEKGGKENHALLSLREASHGILADRLARWAGVQRQMQPMMDRLEARQKDFETLASEYLQESLTVWPWEHTSGNPNSLDDILTFEHETKTVSGVVEKASCYVVGDATVLATHLWCNQNRASDVALLTWQSGPVEYELRRRQVKHVVPFTDDREVLYIRTLSRLPDQCIALLSCSLSPIIVQSLETEHEWFRVPPKTIRSWIVDCQLVKQVCPGICHIERRARFLDPPDCSIPFIVRTVSGDSFNVKEALVALKSAVVNEKLESAAVPLAALTAGAAVGAVAGPLAVTGIVATAGFGSTGIVAGTAAASFMSASAIAGGGGVASGSAVAIGQSIGAVGLVGVPLGFAIAIAGGVIVVGGAAVGIFFGAKAIHKKVGDVKRTQGGIVHHCPSCDDRKLSNL